MLGKIEGRRKRGRHEVVGWYHRLNGHESEQTQGTGKDREAWHAALHGVTDSQMQLND